MRSGRALESGKPGIVAETRGAAPAVPRSGARMRRILLASTGAPFEREVIDRVIKLAGEAESRIYVLSIAKIYGTSLGFPHPGLKPTKREVDEQKRIIGDAAGELQRRGFEVRARVIMARNPTKMIASWAFTTSADAVVMADPDRPRWRRIVEGDPVKDVERRAKIPVHAVPTPARTRGRRNH